MVLEDYKNPNERMARLKNPDSEVFKTAYLGLVKSVSYAERKFKNTAIFPNLQAELAKYTPRFNQLSSHSSQCHSSKHRQNNCGN